jgi:hypothetical protein
VFPTTHSSFTLHTLLGTLCLWLLPGASLLASVTVQINPAVGPGASTVLRLALWAKLRSGTRCGSCHCQSRAPGPSL